MYKRLLAVAISTLVLTNSARASGKSETDEFGIQLLYASYLYIESARGAATPEIIGFIEEASYVMYYATYAAVLSFVYDEEGNEIADDQSIFWAEFSLTLSGISMTSIANAYFVGEPAALEILQNAYLSAYYGQQYMRDRSNGL